MADLKMDKIVSLCKNRGFIFQGSEIYGGLANTWDYGPLGNELKNNINLSEICTLEKNSVYFQNGIIYQCQDIENQKEVYIVTGIDNLGLAYWGKTVV